MYNVIYVFIKLNKFSELITFLYYSGSLTKAKSHKTAQKSNKTLAGKSIVDTYDNSPWLALQVIVINKMG